MKQHIPFRYDTVGSFLRPPVLKAARIDFMEGKITREELTAIENVSILELIEKQKAAGLHAITDGEFRRSSWHLDFMWAFEGIGHEKTKEGVPFAGEPAMIDDTFLTGKIAVGHHPFVEHFRFVQAQVDQQTVARQTIPSPAQFLFQMLIPGNIEQTQSVYQTQEELIGDVAAAYRKIIMQLYDAGCRNLQFDDCTWGVCVDPAACMILDVDEAGLENLIDQFIRVNNLALEMCPKDLTTAMHICRGNFHSTWACQGGYERVARKLFSKLNVDALYLEYDDERSGGFEPLQFVSEEKQVVLGLITTKQGELEQKDTVKARIAKAARYMPLQRLALSPQCGFASTIEGNCLSEAQQWDKIRLVREIAQEVWEDA